MTIFIAVFVGITVGMWVAVLAVCHYSSKVVITQSNDMVHAIYTHMGDKQALAWQHDKALSFLKSESMYARYKNNRAYDALDRLRKAVYAAGAQLG